MVRPRELHGRRRRAAWIRARNRLIPPAEIPNQAAKAPSKRIEPATRKLQRPQTVVLPPKETTDIRFLQDGDAARNRGTVRVAAFDAIADYQSRSVAILRREVLRRVLGHRPQKVSKCTHFREERRSPVLLGIPTKNCVVAANQACAG